MTDIVDPVENDLLEAAATGGVDALEAAWLDHLDPPKPAAFFLDALEALPEAHRRGVAGSLLSLLLETYQSQEAHADILITARALVPYRPKRVDLREVAEAALRNLHGGEEWFELFWRLSDVETDGLLDGLERFHKLIRLLPGGVVYHRTGWGEGVVTRVDLARADFFVRFRGESTERSMPFTTGLDVLQDLPDHDLRARLLVDLEGLQRDATEKPSHLVRAVARLHKGRATSKEIKQWLSPAVVATSAWASWWKKAKVAASRDPFIAVDNPSRPIFVLRKRALSPDDEVREAMDRAPDLPALLEVVGGPLSLDPTPELETTILARLEAGLEGPQQPAARAEATLLLSRHGRRSKEEVGGLLRSLLNEGLAFGPLVKGLSSSALRREAFEAFVAAEPRLWSDAIIGALAELPPGLLGTVAERLVADGRGAALANRLHIFLLSPSKQPETVLRLAKRYAAGLFDGVQGAPSLTEVFMGLLHLAETQAPRAARDVKPAKDAMKGVTDLFLARRAGLVERFAADASRIEMERAMGVLARCRSMPDEIGNALGGACKKRFPDLVPRDETPFWETNNILCSRAGLARKQEEYRVLTHEKIPENSEQIGRAASYGDLSENYEWAAAIEQQRQLTERAAAMDAELRLARAIEDQELDAGLVSPGTRVSYQELAADGTPGKTKTIAVLGPWDTGEHVVSYRAPVAAGMLGARAGEKATLELPEGPLEVTILSVDAALDVGPASAEG